MEITTEPLENRQLRLTIEVDEERSQRALHRAARRISKEVDIPGFRKGKAPYDLIVQRFGEKTLRQEAVETLIGKVYREAVEQKEIEPFGPAELEEMDLEPFVFTFLVPLEPVVELGDYRSYRRKRPKVKVSKKEVQEALQRIREDNVVMEPAERPAAMGDGVLLDLSAQTPDGEKILDQDDIQIVLDPDSADPAPGFAEEIAGMEAGEERTFTLRLADDFPRQELQGQDVEFTAHLHEVYDRKVPDLDDDLARTVGKFDSVKELEQYVRDQLEQAAQQEADEEYADQVVSDIVEQARVEYPPVLLEQRLDQMVADMERAVRRQAHLSLEEYLRFQGRSEEDLREELEPKAVADLERALVLGEVVKEEGLEVEEEEIAAEIEEASASWGVKADEVRTALSSDQGRSALRSRLLGSKAVRWLVAIAKGESPEKAEEAEEE